MFSKLDDREAALGVSPGSDLLQHAVSAEEQENDLLVNWRQWKSFPLSDLSVNSGSVCSPKIIINFLDTHDSTQESAV